MKSKRDVCRMKVQGYDVGVGAVGTLVGGDLQSGFVGLEITRNASHEPKMQGVVEFRSEILYNSSMA